MAVREVGLEARHAGAQIELKCVGQRIGGVAEGRILRDLSRLMYGEVVGCGCRFERAEIHKGSEVGRCPVVIPLRVNATVIESADPVEFSVAARVQPQLLAELFGRINFSADLQTGPSRAVITLSSKAGAVIGVHGGALGRIV